MIWLSFIAGLLTQASLIMVIGAQNTFVLRQGLSCQHVGMMVTFCIVSDIILAAIGMIGLGAAVSLYPNILGLLKTIAIGFLFIYAVFSLRRAITHTQAANALDSQTTKNNRMKIIMLLIGVTWLNPYVWLDAVVFMGSIMQTYPTQARLPFFLGVAMMSTIWFIALGYGARFLSPLFQRPTSWRLLDIGTGVLMSVLAGILIAQSLAILISLMLRDILGI